MSRNGHTIFMRTASLLFLLLFCAQGTVAQPPKAYAIKNGRMYVQLMRDIPAASLDSFIRQFDLSDIGLTTFLRKHKPDSVLKAGWQIEQNNEVAIIICKPLEAFGRTANKNDDLLLKHLANENDPKEKDPLFPAVNNGVVAGVNRFRNKASFYRGDSLVRFFLRGYKEARNVMLAGSFNNWKPDQLSMQKTDSGWMYTTKLGPGKYWYKFITDGRWLVDGDNPATENDGRGNVNSIFFRPNVLFTLPGMATAKKVSVAGSFNKWKPDDLLLNRTPTGWELPVYLAGGTHTYKFVVDGVWTIDAANKETLPNGYSGFNSVIQMGKPHLFKLAGYEGAKEVRLAGTFNQWRDFELPLKRTASGWEVNYVLGPGNHEYKFKVDGKWISDPANLLTSSATGNSFIVIEPNYTFHLSGFTEAATVYLAGDFNDWDPKAYPMQKNKNGWTFPVHLSAGKHTYKFIVNGKWIIDPGNKLWEQNRYDTGNSIVWIEQ